MKNYDISVIVPVYNCEKYLNKCIKSLINQNYDFRKIEVLLINDGSVDNSLKMCEEYAKKYSNIKVFTHENKGVSYTRNVGLLNAKGAYITFLDPDDYLSNNAIGSLISFFDNHYDEVDLVTYSIYYDKDGKIVSAPKNESYPKTGIYDLNSEKFYNISTINFVIKNKKSSNLLFDEKLKIHEDMDYSMRVALKKCKIGCVKEAIYYYYKHEDSAVSNHMNPYYTFENWIKQFEVAFKTYKDENGKPIKFVQYLFLNEVNWKLQSKLLYPIHYSEDKLKKAIQRVSKLMNKIDDEIILKDKSIDKFHKYYFLQMKQNNFEILSKDYVELLSNGKLIAKEKDFEIVLTGFKVLNDILYINGYFKSYLFNFTTPKFYVNVDGNISELSTKLSTNSCYKTIYKTNNFYHFDLQLDVNSNFSAEFKVKINDKMYPVKYYLMPTIVLNKSLNRMTYLYKNNLVGINENNNIIITKITENKKNEIIKKNELMYNKINKRINYFRKLSDVCKNEIWLYNDKNNVIDNAYYQFKHDLAKNDGIKRYYVINNDKSYFKDKFTKKELKYVVKFRSLKHKILYLNSTKILTSFRNIEFYSPFYKNISYYQDLLKYQLIYLQHGILHCHAPNLYSKESNQIDKIVVSSEFEYNNFIDNYNYTHNNLIKSGMPRFDLCDTTKTKSKTKKILIALSWRVNLMGKYNGRGYDSNLEKYKKSEYYNQLQKLLTSDKFKKLLKTNDLTVEVMSHPIFRVYDETLEVDGQLIKLVKSANPTDYDLIITDYSSIVFDYVYANVPVMYFVPDYDLYKAGITHIYNELDLPMEEGFGPFTTNIESLIKELEEFIKNNYKLNKRYEQKSKNFFINKIDHRENLYNELMER